MNNTIMESNYSALNEFEAKDVLHAVKQFEEIRKKNKIPSHTFEGKTGLLITVSITKHKNIHVNWRMK
jgi:uncharacterized protein YjbK